MDPENTPASPPPPELEPHTAIPAAPSVASPDERTICVIKRHPIGILGVYVMCGLVLVVTAVLAFVVAPGVAGGNTSQAMLGGALVFVVVAVLCAVFAMVASKVYWGNSWTVTSESIIQVKRTGLFDKQTSQLSLDNLEDITAAQNGIFPETFHYGVLSAETAAATDKFTFIYCPNPNYYVQQILEARESFRQARPNNPVQTPQA